LGHPIANCHFIIKPFYSSANPENLVNIDAAVSEIICLIGRPLKKENKHRKNIHNPPGMHTGCAEQNKAMNTGNLEDHTL